MVPREQIRSSAATAVGNVSGMSHVAHTPLRAATGHRTFSSEFIPAESTSLDRWALEQIRATVAAAPIRFVLWDGFELAPHSPIATIVFKNRKALLSWVWDAELYFGEAYMFGAVEVQGDLVALLEAVYSAQ